MRAILMINNLDLKRVAVSPPKTDPPLIVDSNAVVAGAIALELLQAVAAVLALVSCGDSLCGRSWKSARQRATTEILPRMHDREHLDGGRTCAIENAVRSFDDLAHVEIARLRHVATRLGKVLRLAKPNNDSFDDLFGVHGRGEAEVFRDAPQLLGGLLRPAERQAHEARRIRLRTRASASSCVRVWPWSACARPCSSACRTYTS